MSSKREGGRGERPPSAGKGTSAPDPTERSSPEESGLIAARVPSHLRAIFRTAQDFVARYFADRADQPAAGTITISGERYLLVRAASMSVEFVDLVVSLYRDHAPQEAAEVASNLLFDFAHAMGRADARAFHERLGVQDPVERLSAGPMHFAHAGWALVDIHPSSNLSAGRDFFLEYEHPFSFESDAWRRRGRTSTTPVCVMNAGYSSGWCEESFAFPLVAVEIECLAAGGERCRFIMAPPDRIEDHLARLAHEGTDEPARPSARSAPVRVPEFFQRKRLEEELRRSYQDLERRVEERTAELTEANQRLQREVEERERAERARDEFLSVAAHELKTPLTSLLGFSQLLGRQLDGLEGPDPERLRRALAAIDRQSHKLDQLVSHLLDVSRIEAGQLALEPVYIDLVPLVRGVVEVSRVRSSRHVLELEVPPSLAAVVDPLRIEQVLTNLIDNAFKYSPEGSTVRVLLRGGPAEALLEVVDEGPGIPPGLRQSIFERFRQASPVNRAGGIGLGLYISRQIVALHGGRITAHEAPGGGTRIEVRFPRAADLGELET